MSLDVTQSSQTDFSQKNILLTLRRIAKECIREQKIKPPTVQAALSFEETEVKRQSVHRKIQKSKSIERMTEAIVRHFNNHLTVALKNLKLTLDSLNCWILLKYVRKLFQELKELNRVVLVARLA